MHKPSNILCVDDDDDFCELIAAMLHYADTDYQLTSVATPHEALDLLTRKSFDLFIFDYNLPQMSGVELCRRIRAADPTTPIIFYTATSQQRDRDAAMAAGASIYLVKPNDLENVVPTIETLLGN